MGELTKHQTGDIVRVSAKPGHATRPWSCDGYFVDYRDVHGSPGFRVNWGDENFPSFCDFPLETHQADGFPLLHQLRTAVAEGRVDLDEAVRRIAEETDTELLEAGARHWITRIDPGEQR